MKFDWHPAMCTHFPAVMAILGLPGPQVLVAGADWPEGPAFSYPARSSQARPRLPALKLTLKINCRLKDFPVLSRAELWGQDFNT